MYTDLTGNSPQHMLRETTLKLLAYCWENDWAGFDPYDALNSRVLAYYSIQQKQIMADCIRSGYETAAGYEPAATFRDNGRADPKALALFLMAFLKLEKLGRTCREAVYSPTWLERLMALRSPGVSFWCWGYSFPWQTRTVLVLVASPQPCLHGFCRQRIVGFVRMDESRFLEMSVCSEEYLLNELYWSEGDQGLFQLPLIIIAVARPQREFPCGCVAMQGSASIPVMT